MKTKTYKENYSKKANKKPVKNKRLVDYKWIGIVTVSAFLISVLFSFISELVMPSATAVVATIIILLFIGIGILFDIIGIEKHNI
jgi:membrane protein YdbS with pleckstrin-like domain